VYMTRIGGNTCSGWLKFILRSNSLDLVDDLFIFVVIMGDKWLDS
jgi:hypothetical protein